MNFRLDLQTRFAEKIKLWLDIINFSDVSLKAKEKFREYIFSSEKLQSADNQLKDGIRDNVSWGLSCMFY